MIEKYGVLNHKPPMRIASVFYLIIAVLITPFINKIFSLNNISVSLFLPYIYLLVIVLIVQIVNPSNYFKSVLRFDYSYNVIIQILIYGTLTFAIAGFGYTLTKMLGIEILTNELVNQSMLKLVLFIAMAAILEEIIFRGIMFYEFKKIVNKEIIIVLITALIFSIFHLSYSQLLSTFLIGLLLGWLMLKYNNIVLNIGVHVFYNLLGISLLYLSSKF